MQQGYRLKLMENTTIHQLDFLLHGKHLNLKVVLQTLFDTYFYNYIANTTVLLLMWKSWDTTAAIPFEPVFCSWKDSIQARGVSKEKELRKKSYRSSITVNANNISNAVKKGEFGSYVTQYYDRVITAFNNSEQICAQKFLPGKYSLYENGVSSSKKKL